MKCPAMQRADPAPCSPMRPAILSRMVKIQTLDHAGHGGQIKGRYKLCFVALLASVGIRHTLGEPEHAPLPEGGGFSKLLEVITTCLEAYLPKQLIPLVASFDAWAMERASLPRATAVVLVLAAAAVVLSLAMAVLFGPAGGKNSRGRSRMVLLVGPCGAGKTLLLHTLCSGKGVETVTSMKPSQMALEQGTKTVTLVDFPGHQRLRPGLGEALARAAGVVFVIDCSDLGKQLGPTAELLYDILTHSSMESSRGLLVACNKADLKASKPAKVLALLQRELEKLRETRATMALHGDEQDDRAGAGVPLGRQGVPLDLAVDSPCPVQAVSCSASHAQVDEVSDFVGRIGG
ncbi:unnamed protein product [Chrysoparadoxa australica]